MALNVGQFVLRNARRMPDRPALVWRGAPASWQVLNQRINRTAHVLQRHGAGPGTPVATLLDNCVELLEVYFACAKIGAIFVPIMPRSVGPEIAHILGDVGALILVVDQKLAADLPDEKTVGTVITLGSGDAFDYERLVHDATPAEPDISVDPDAIAAIKYTSGTTGVPKGCTRTHRQTALSAVLYLGQIPHSEQDRATVSSPLAAGFGLSLCNAFALAGVATHLLPKFDAADLLETIAREKITLAYAIQSTFNAFTRHPDLDSYDLASVRLFTGTSATQDTIVGLRKLRRHPTFRGGFFNAYGSSEAVGYISYNMPEDMEQALSDPVFARRVESIGREGFMCRIECVDDDLHPVPAGEVGEMAVSSPTTFSGYWGRPDASAAVLRSGWLVTGDLALKDADGFLYLAGRTRDMIKTGGINVYPAEIEFVLAGHPDVAEVAVVGVPDPRWGEVVVACVVLSAPCSEDLLLRFCADQLAGYKRPKSVRFMHELPKSETGKIVKRELRELLISSGADVEA
jgi:fatty-acyl-CoA synthase